MLKNYQIELKLFKKMKKVWEEQNQKFDEQMGKNQKRKVRDVEN